MNQPTNVTAEAAKLLANKAAREARAERVAQLKAESTSLKMQLTATNEQAPAAQDLEAGWLSTLNYLAEMFIRGMKVQAGEGKRPSFNPSSPEALAWLLQDQWRNALPNLAASVGGKGGLHGERLTEMGRINDRLTEIRAELGNLGANV